MLKRLYDWTLSLAARKSAEWWLFAIAFVESSVFVIPAEVLFCRWESRGQSACGVTH